MVLTLQIRIHTEFGQSLLLTGNHELLGGGAVERALPLHYLNDQIWEVSMILSEANLPDSEIRYNYILRETDGSLVYDWGNDKVITAADFQKDEVLILDSWNNPGFYENAFYTEPFQQVLLKANHTEVRQPAVPAATHTFKAKAPLLAKGQTLCLVGEGAALGNWDTAKPILLNRPAGHDFFTVDLDLREVPFPLAYKYGVYDVENQTFVGYEKDPNRMLEARLAPAVQEAGAPAYRGNRVILNDGFARLPADTWKGAGVAIPVFSLRSEASFGVGEFADLKLLADWCRRAGLKLIQLLPINDTTATHTCLDSYPYSAISAFALHPLYLNLGATVDEANRPLLAQLEPERKRLNALPAVDYEGVMHAKMAFINRIYPLQKEQTFRREEFKRFFEANKHWLTPYAAFCHLRDKHGTSDFNQWPELRTYTEEAIAALSGGAYPAADELALHYFIQFHLHLQLREATEHAHARGVILKGDLAIGVSSHGADAWQKPELFHLDMQAGAPPDAFSAKGQNWSMPTYNWPRMRETGFEWWKGRFEQLGRYSDALRIDHILGFFRIWSIPLHAVEGIMGHFVPAIPIHLDELSQRGIRYDLRRFTQPYITDPILREHFGADDEIVKAQFLLYGGGGYYSLRPEFSTQRQVEQYFASLELPGTVREPDPSVPGGETASRSLSRLAPAASGPGGAGGSYGRLRQGLFDLISNVILLQEPGSNGQHYHFRFAAGDTSSFKALDAHTQAQLKDLYVDYFFRRQDPFWAKEALGKLPALKRVTNMLICGEDLGMVPACVPEVMRELGLLGLEIQRMPKALNQAYSRPREAPYLSVVSPGTHDMSTFRGWWKENKALIQKFYNEELGRTGPAPEDCPGEIVKAILLQHLASPAMWSIFQLQDLFGADERLRRDDIDAERINVPANPRNYWNYRMHLSLETLLKSDAFNSDLRSCLEQHGRCAAGAARDEGEAQAVEKGEKESLKPQSPSEFPQPGGAQVEIPSSPRRRRAR
jgi:4-alpha-glucanotransferase